MSEKKKCPIFWRNSDGPYPCAFKEMNGDCNFTTSIFKGCIDLHMKKYLHAMSEKVTTCPECDAPVTTTTGNFERGRIPLCHRCNDRAEEADALADHIRGY